MSQKSTNSIFDSYAISLIKLYMLEGGVAGFRIPTYQRQYDWDKKNIDRLFEDIISGLYWRANDPNSLTFLGTIIVLDEKDKESSFDGRSLSVIDGQQRLTTLSIFACALYDEIKNKKKLLDEIKIPINVKNWLNDESRALKFRLLNFVFGQLPEEDGYNRFPFPRIVREEARDYRANSDRYSEYNSIIAKFLFDFSSYVRGEDKTNNSESFVFNYPDTQDGKNFATNVIAIKEVIKKIYLTDNENLTISLPKLKDFSTVGFRALFTKLPSNQDETNKIISYCRDNGHEIIHILMLLSFISFFTGEVIITLVKVTNEKYGFDIFDSLNTTGEPLTAIQTFKPQVIRFEKQQQNKKYVGSNSESCISNIENYLDEISGSQQKQRAAKDIVVSFALYKTGEAVSLKLDEQRKYLHTTFNKPDIKNKKISVPNKRIYIQNLEEVAKYRKMFWTSDKNTFGSQLSDFPEKDLVLCCLRFLRDSNHSLTIPILCRYYYAAIKSNNKSLFSDAVKAVTSFVVLRRSVTGGTSGIDSDLRKLMSNGRRRKNLTSTPICFGLEQENQLVTIPILREYLREWLEKKRIEVTDKLSWTEKVISQPLYKSSTPLCRFLLLLATHHSRPNKTSPNLLVKGRRSQET